MQRRRFLCAVPTIPLSALVGWPFAAHAQTPSCIPFPTIVGTWWATTTFQSGPRAGQPPEQATFHFLKGKGTGGSLTVEIEGVLPIAHGRWWPAGKGICYCFVEPVTIANQSLLVAVNHFLALSDLKTRSFISNGEGNVYPFPNGLSGLPLITTSLSSTRATRVA